MQKYDRADYRYKCKLNFFILNAKKQQTLIDISSLTKIVAILGLSQHIPIQSDYKYRQKY